MEPESAFLFRPFCDDDIPFVSSSWAASYYSASNTKGLLCPEEFHKFHRPLRDRFFKRPTATVIVVSPEEEPSVILGWIATEVLPNCSVVHYLYVKSDYRKEFHLARELTRRAVPPGPVFYTHLTRKAMRIIGKHPELFSDWQYMPHLT